MTKIFPIKMVALLLVFLSVSIYSPRAQALDPKTKTVLTMAGYGAASGLLLGTASLAFGTNGRAVSVGASIGLYLGLIFGSYVVVSHRMKSYQGPADEPQRRNYYPGADQASPYTEDGGGLDWFGGGGAEEDPGAAQYWESMQIRPEASHQRIKGRKMNHWGGESPDDTPLFYMNLVQYNF